MLDVGSTEAADIAASFGDILTGAGGVDLARRAETSPDERAHVAELLDSFGLWEIDPLADEEQLFFASVLCHRAGSLNLPYPIAERFAASRLADIDACCVVGSTTPIISHGGLGLRWAGVNGDGLSTLIELPVGSTRTRISPFAAPVRLGNPVPEGRPERREALSHLLSGFVLLGVCDSAAADTYAYTQTRKQFGSPIASFQGIRFSLTDVATALQGAREIGLHALWSFAQDRDEALADALVFRVAMLEAASTTFARTHQAHGAIGLCDETDLSWFSRHSRILRHAPWGLSRTERRLLEVAGAGAVTGPFSG